MKINTIYLLLSIIIIINIAGCSVVRFTETRMGYGMKKANKTEFKLDFQFDYNPSNRSFTLNLARQPYSIYKPKITLNDLGVGLATLGLFAIVVYDNWDHDNTFDFTDDTFDWYELELWEKAVLIGVPADILLYWTVAYPLDWKAVKMQRQPLTDHPYSIILPDHGGNGVDYKTITGEEQIEIKDFLSQLVNPTYLRGVDSLKFRAVTIDVREKKHSRDYTVDWPIPNHIKGPDPPPNPLVKIQTEWEKNSIRSGESAILKITVQNTGNTLLTELVATTESTNPHFNNWKLNFGDIQQGNSESRSIRFSTDVETRAQDITVTLRFITSTGEVSQKTTKVLTIMR